MMPNFRMLILPFVVAAPLAAAPPSTDTLINNAIIAAGGAEAFSALGVLELAIDEQENQLDGNIRTSKMTSMVQASDLDNQRLELMGNLILVRNGEKGWASKNDVVDTRAQAPRMAVGTVNQKVFPLLLPFSLDSRGVYLSNVRESTFEETASWRADMKFTANFFTSPTMNTTWHLEFAKDDGRLLAAEFQPPAKFAAALKEGVRYRVLRSNNVGGIKLPAEVLLDGIDSNGIETGHTRIVRVKVSVRGPWEPGLFVHPDRLEAFEDGEIPGLS